MKYGLDEFGIRRDGATVPTIWLALVLSLIVHLALMWQWLPRIRLPSPDADERGKASSGSLVVRLMPPPRAPAEPAPSVQVQPPPAPRPPPRPAVRPPPPPPVIALNTPAPKATPTVPAPTPPAPAVAPSSPLRPPAEGDLAAYIEARRRGRGDSSAPPSIGSSADAIPAETDAARSNRIAAANLGTQRKQTFGYDPRQGGGVFQLVRVGYNDGEFMFFGWNKDIRRNTKQLIEVRKGNNPDTRIAIVRKMIAIIRDYEQEDFLWESQRLGRSLMLSARARDNPGLEEFMLREFFDDPNRPPPQ